MAPMRPLPSRTTLAAFDAMAEKDLQEVMEPLRILPGAVHTIHDDGLYEQALLWGVAHAQVRADCLYERCDDGFDERGYRYTGYRRDMRGYRYIKKSSLSCTLPPRLPLLSAGGTHLSPMIPPLQL